MIARKPTKATERKRNLLPLQVKVKERVSFFGETKERVSEKQKMITEKTEGSMSNRKNQNGLCTVDW